MTEIWGSFNNREIALVVWLMISILLCFGLAKSSMLEVVRAFLKPIILVSFLGLAAYGAILTAVFTRLGLWDISLLKDTVFWYAATAVLHFRAAMYAGEDKHLFRNIILNNLKIALIIEFALSFYAMPLWAELLLVPILVVLGGMQVLAESKKEHRILLRPLGFVINVLSIGIAANGAYLLVRGFLEFTTIETLKQFLLAPTLTVFTVPYILVFALWVQYEAHFIRLGYFLKDRPELCTYAKLRSLLDCGFDRLKLKKLSGSYYYELQEAADRTVIKALTRKYVHAPDPCILPGTVERVRVVPYELPLNGQLAQKALIDWTNTSDQPVSAAFAEIIAFDEDGRQIHSGATEYCIFSCENDDMKINPGETYVEPESQGFILLSNAFGWANRVEARITRLLA